MNDRAPKYSTLYDIDALAERNERLERKWRQALRTCGFAYAALALETIWVLIAFFS